MTTINHNVNNELPPAKRQKGIEYTGITVVFFCHDGDGQFVMARRTLDVRDEQGRWDIGGGGLEFGERVDDTLRKEIFEEYGTTVRKAEFLGFRDVHRRPAGVRTHWVSLDYKVLVDRTSVRNCEPHKFSSVEWFTREMLPPSTELHSQLPTFFSLYEDRLWP